MAQFVIFITNEVDERYDDIMEVVFISLYSTWTVKLLGY